jgi:TetR/AcrR family transcriptional repressor of nem operon
MAEDPSAAAEVVKPMAQWVEFVADIVRRGQTSGDFRPQLDAHAVAAVLVGAFDGLKALTDVLDPGAAANTVFRQRVQVLLELIEHGLPVQPAS